MSDESERGRWTISNLVTQRSALIVCVVGIAAFVALSIPEKVFGSASLKEALLGLAAAVFGVATVGLLWETTVRKAFFIEIDRRLVDLLDSYAAQAQGAAAARREGLIDLTQDFKHAIPFREYINASSRIDICWWAGRGWFKDHLVELSAAGARGAAFTVILPAVDEARVQEQMEIDSGRSAHRLIEATTESEEILRHIHGVTVLHSKVVPRYMYMRLGDVTVFCPYSLVPGLNDRRPNVLIRSNASMGIALALEFQTLRENILNDVRVGE